MILYEKIINALGKEEAKKRLGEDTFYRLQKENTNLRFYYLCQKIDLEKEVGYTFEDFEKDFDNKISKYKEKKIVYNIWKQGISLYQYSLKIGVSEETMYRVAKKGREIVGEHLKFKLLDTFEVPYNIHDIDNFEVIVHEEYCKLIGNKEELEKLAEKYEIDYPVLCYDNQYSLTFNGWFFRVIKAEYIKAKN